MFDRADVRLELSQERIPLYAKGIRVAMLAAGRISRGGKKFFSSKSSSSMPINLAISSRFATAGSQ